MQVAGAPKPHIVQGLTVYLHISNEHSKNEILKYSICNSIQKNKIRIKKPKRWKTYTAEIKEDLNKQRKILFSGCKNTVKTAKYCCNSKWSIDSIQTLPKFQ